MSKKATESVFDKGNPLEEMKPFRDYSAHTYPSDDSSRGIMVQWYHGHMNGMPFKWPVITWPKDWKVDDFRFYEQDRIEANDPGLIIFVEDEASADALISEGHFATTIPAMGVSPYDLDWSLFAGKQVIVWPDNYSKPSTKSLEVIDCISNQEPISLKVVKHTYMLPENWNANLLIYEAEDGALMGYARENAIPVSEYVEELDDKGEFEFKEFWYPRFPPENHPDHAYA